MWTLRREYTYTREGSNVNDNGQKKDLRIYQLLANSLYILNIIKVLAYDMGFRSKVTSIT